MTFIHWIQAIWLLATAAVIGELVFVNRTRKKLKKQGDQLAAMIRTFERINSTLDPYPNAITNTNPQREEPRA